MQRLTIETVIDEKNDGGYGYNKVASHTLTINLPVDPDDIALAFKSIYSQLLAQAMLFGKVVNETTNIE